MLRTIYALFVFVWICQADSIVTTTAGWNQSAVNPTHCIDTESGSGGSGSSCGADYAQGSISTLTGPVIPGFQGSVSAATDATVFSFARVTATDTYSEGLVVTGGNGAGTLVLDFGMTGSGFDDYGTGGAEMAFSATGLTGFGSWGPGTCPESGAPDMFVCQTIQPNNTVTPYYEVSSSIPITLGVPFSFTEELMLYASGNDGIPAYGWVNGASVYLLGYSVLDAKGNPIKGLSLSDPPLATPEPASWLYIIAGVATMLAYRKAPKRYAMISIIRIVPKPIPMPPPYPHRL